MAQEKKYNAIVSAVGMYFPEKVYDNKYFESIIETTEEWILTRTGIKERRILEKGATSDLATNAALDLIKKHKINPEEIDCIIVATVTPDMFFPATACLVQKRIGAINAWGFDLEAACSGFLFAFQTGCALVESGQYKKVMVIGADKMSSIVDYTDRNNCILFGDGASAVLLEPSEDKRIGLQDSILRVDGSGEAALHMKGGGSLNPPTHNTVDSKLHYLYQDGKAVFKVAVKGMADVSYELMQQNKLKSEDIAYLVPHQANLRIIDATAERMGLSKDKVMINIDRYGNTTAATIPSCLTEYYRNGKIKKGDKLILAAFGAGYTWGACYIVWAID
ncbi:MAG: ketoacyl-ACP synthase III [Ignavibacteriota bacterium]|jgi:3-oxoacyl-[acyl-carrier-protein] synthase-3|nr:MAG: ketoacyl-ACP synthase III [Chlorobiota bacterium]MBE7477161.1 ketoacyl-ACP synthase III [Ignavibacteriales bacterium]MBL1121363.1 ketoacyl-ACP synthase III [Ignavibacteriota bacterium]MCC7093159.1 ketoacyl-ACP synthase III [Ignavibacteriaceae bacterium]MCE7855197.1 ketoacyl-ACP synthase III [Ignavibacteria bacterium CHB3]MEB2297494.1 ketoacyl-ACP synthase III [Ignavibacteria bacterium]